jgi:hypothetical protein
LGAADAEASLGWGARDNCERAKAVASHRTPNTIPWAVMVGSERNTTESTDEAEKSRRKVWRNAGVEEREFPKCE